MAGPILWPFSTNHFYVWELITIGTSSFFLALEPNNERLKGHFLMNIFRKLGYDIQEYHTNTSDFYTITKKGGF